MKKIMLFLLTLTIVVGCACSMRKASDAVKEYIGKYNNEDEEVLVELEKLLDENDFSLEEREKYKEVMLKQYKDLSYKIVSESYNGEEATVTTKITVYDLYQVQQEAEEYKKNHQDEFLDENNNYDKDKFLKYKLEQMRKNTKTIEYTIDFKVIKQNGKWEVKNVSTEDLEKIHGIYHY